MKEAQTLNPPQPQQTDPPLKQLWNSLRHRNSRFQRTYDEFVTDMQDENARKQLHASLQKQDPSFKRTFEEFSMDILGQPQSGPSGSKKKDELADLPSTQPESPTSPEPLAPESSASSSSPQPEVQSVVSQNFDPNLAKLAQLDPKLITGGNVSLDDERAKFEQQRAEAADTRNFLLGKKQEPKGFFDDPAAGVMQAIGSFNKAVVSGATSVPKTVGILANALDDALGTSDSGKKVEDYATYQLGDWLDKKALQWGIGVTDPKRDASFSSAVFQGLGSVASMILLGGPKGFLARESSGLAAQGISQAAAVRQGLKDVGESLTSRASFAGSVAMAVPEFEAAKRAGLSDKDAFMVFLKNYGVGTTEALPIANALERINKVAGGKLIDFAKAGLNEGLEEFIQEGVQNTVTNNIAQGSYDPSRDLFQDVLKQAGAGFFVGFILPGVGMAMQNMSPEDRQATQGELNTMLKDYAKRPESRITVPEGDLGTKPSKESAVPEPISKAVDVGEPSGNGEALGERNAKEQKTAQENITEKEVRRSEQDLTEEKPVEPEHKPKGNVVVDEAGNPIKVYRGQHGSAEVESRQGSISFSDDPNDAKIYSESPNNRELDAEVKNPNIIEANISIENPVINTPDDPFIELGTIKNILGDDEAREIARKYSDQIVNTNNWEEKFADRYSSVEDLLKDKPDAIDELYMNAFPIFDDKSIVEKFKKKGYDGAIHAGYGEGQGTEYKVFSPDQIKVIKPKSNEEEQAMKANEGKDEDVPDTDVGDIDPRGNWKVIGTQGQIGDVIQNDNGDEFKIADIKIVKNSSGKGKNHMYIIEDTQGKQYKINSEADFYIKPKTDETTTPPQLGKPVQSAKVREDTAEEGTPVQTPQEPAEKVPAEQQPGHADGGTPDAGGKYIADVEPRLGSEDLNKIGLRKIAEKYGISDDRQIKELTEVAITNRAREIAKEPDAYDKLVKLYESQPTLAHRTSESIAKQQYSTPIPIAYLGGKYINADKVRQVFEPSAGNGMLTIVADPKNVTVNEIDKLRGQNLSRQGFAKVTSQDASKPFGMDKKFDAVITNPPFGGTAVTMIDGYKFNELAQIMSVRALETMKDNGKAAIIIGGNNEYDEKGRLIGRDRLYFNYLYNRYNVDDVIDISGDLYRKQGASFPIRLILINGRKDTPGGVAPLKEKFGPKVTDFKGLGERVSKLFSEPNIQADENTDLQPAELAGGTSTNVGGRGAGDERQTPAGASQGPAEGQVPQPSGESDIGRTETGTDRGGSVGSEPAVGRPAGDSGLDTELGSVSQPDVEPGRESGDNLDSGPKDVTTDVRRDRPRTDRKVVAGALSEQSGSVDYQPASKGKTMNVKIPSSMAQEMYDAIARVKEEVGDLDQYVRTKLHYKSNKELYDALGAEQVDSVAMAIWNIENGDALIVGHQTGVGKGRIAASIIRYGNYNGYKPIFLTEKPNLFGAIYRDLKAIGHGNIKPFIVNNIGDKFSGVRDKEDGGNIIHKAYPSGHPEHKKALQSLQIPDDTQVVLATYSQFGNPNYYEKVNFIKAISQNNILILDESHNASGAESNTGTVFQEIIPQAKGVVYLSGTYAKRPDNMPVYALKTAMKEANMEKEELVAAVENGGVALQEIVSGQLAESGQIVRLQRSLEDISVTNNVLQAQAEEHRKAADTITDLVREIIRFQKRYVSKKVSELDNEISAMESDTRFEQRKGTKDAGVDNYPYFSKVFNVIDQMLYSLKAKETANEAIKLLKEGKKPFIAIRGTLESALNDLIDAGDVNYGDTVEADFSYLMQKGLDGVLRITIHNPDGSTTYDTINPRDLGDMGLSEYNRIREKIKASTSGLSISPIDELVQTIEAAGYSVGEVTGRQTKLRLSSGKKKVGVLERKRREPVDKAYIKYNSGEYDVIVVNSSGSTGEDAHADAKFKDKRVRVQLVLQPELNINTLVQIIGRVNRTGQVVKPEYQFVNSVIPAEQRLMSMTMRKLKSLDANTTSNQKQSKGILDVPEFFNKYGDQIVVEYLKENPEVIEMIDDPLKMLNSEDLEPTKGKDAAMRVSGRIAILPVKEQEKFYNEIIDRYNKQLEYLNDAGINDLEVTNLPLKANTLSKDVTIMGKGGKSAFGDNTYLEEVEVDVLRKPLTRAEIDAQIAKLAQGQDPKNFVGQVFEQLQRYQENLMQTLEADARHGLDEEIAAIESKAQGKLSPERIAEHVDAARLTSSARLEKRKKTEMQRLEYVKSLLRFFTPGKPVRVPTSLKETKDASAMFFSDGIFMGFDIDLNKPKPFLPSNIRLMFAVNDGRVSIPIPASKTNEINYIRTAAYEIAPERQKAIQEWDTLKKQKGRQKRMMVTGNLLQGLSKYDGKIIKYTTDEGFVQTGILLPDGYDPKEAEEAKTVAVPATKAIEMVRKSPRYTDFNITSDGAVKLANKGGHYTLRVPASKSRGGKYYLDPDLLDLVDGNNFNSVGNEMEATFPDVRLAMVLDVMQNKFGASIDLQKRDFEKALANQTIEMTKRSESTFEPVAQLSLFPWLTPSKVKKKPVNQVELEALQREIKLRNQEAEKRYQDAAGPSPTTGETQWDRIKDSFSDMLVGFTSHFKHLNPTKFPREAAILRVFETVKNSPTEQAKQYMRGLVEPLTKEQYDIFTRRIVLEDLLGGIEKELEVEDNLPFGFKSKKEVEREIEKYTDLMTKEPAAQEAYDRRQAYMDTLHAALVEKGILMPDVDRKTYYHRRVLEYLKGENDSKIIHGKRLSKAYKDWRRARTGTKGKDYSTNFVESEYRVVSEGLYELEKQRILGELMGVYERMLATIKKKFNKDFQQRVEDAENQFGKGSDEVLMLKRNKRSLMRTYIEENKPEGYVWYQPTPGNAIFKKSLMSAEEVEKAVMKAGLTDQSGIGTAMQLIDNILDMADPYVLVGQKRKEYLVPEPLANQLEAMGTSVEPDANIVQAVTSVWKVYVLLNPNRLVRYNLNNFVGDVDGTLAADPTIFKKVSQAWKELREFQRSGRATPDLNEAVRQNVIDSGWEINELADMNKVEWAKLFSDQRGPDLQQAFGQKVVKDLKDIVISKPGELFRTYWDWAKKWTRIRENVLRYAAYLRAKEKIDAGETFYWASNPDQIDGITGAQYKAGKLAREVLGDYGNISITGSRIRRWMVPFYSWMEINMGRYYRLLKNASSPKAQARILGVAAKRGVTAVAFRMMYSYAVLGLLTAIVEAWNWLRFPEEAEKLQRANVRGIQFILSETEDGKIVTIPIVGAFYDALDFFGLPDMKDDLALIFSGEAPVKGALGAAKTFAITPYTKVVQGVNPFLKSGYELITGQQIYPDPTNPRPIYDYGEYFSTFLSVQDEYRALTGTPTRAPYFFGHMRNLVVRDLDPDELSYYMAKRIIETYKGQRRHTEPANAEAQAKSEALYRYGLAVRFGHDDEAQRYLNAYYSHGGTPVGLMASLRGKNPLSQLNARERYDIDKMIDDASYRPETPFGKTLTSKELRVFEDAINYYNRTYSPANAPR